MLLFTRSSLMFRAFPKDTIRCGRGRLSRQPCNQQTSCSSQRENSHKSPPHFLSTDFKFCLCKCYIKVKFINLYTVCLRVEHCNYIYSAHRRLKPYQHDTFFFSRSTLRRNVTVSASTFVCLLNPTLSFWRISKLHGSTVGIRNFRICCSEILQSTA